MKKMMAFAAAISFLVACNNTPKADKAETTDKMEVAAGEGTAYAVDANSTVTWTGSKPTGKHDGIFKISNGSLTVKDSTLTGGNFTIDINSISNTDLAGDTTSKAQLEGHLKSADFFDVAKFPTAKFEITAVEPYVADNSKPTLLKDATHTIKGNLTLKDSTKNVAFPAKIMIDATGAKAVADFNIDRTLWGLNYKGPNNPQDWVISKEVNIKLNISAAKK